jgi:hypothetical protein
MISRKEYMQFIEESWRAAFRLLSEDADSKNYGVKIKDIETWNASKISILNEKSSQIFNTIAGGADVILAVMQKADYQAFRSFVLRGEVKDITAQLDQKTALVPLSLSELQ